MQLTQSDALVVHGTIKLVRALRRALNTDSELVNALFDHLLECETDAGIEQCVAVMPPRLIPQIKARVKETLSKPHPGERFTFGLITPTETKPEELDGRVRRAMTIVTNYLENPTGTLDYEVDDPDGLRQQWFLFRHFETVRGERCRKSGCVEDRIRNGIFCRIHHYEMIHGQPPPDATEQ